MEPVISQNEFEGKINDVTNFHLNWINERNAMEERCSKMQADSNNYLNIMDRLQGELEAVKRELTAAGEKERQTRVKNKHLSVKLKQEEDEVRRLTVMMEHKQDHFNHEVRKKERESLQHKERLCKKIMEKKVDKGTQQVLNTVPRSASGRRPQWGDDPREELYKQLVEEQEERNKELFQENDHLRHCLASLEKELINVINSGNVDESFFEAADLDPKIISHINMPLAVVQDTFKTSIDDKIELIKEKHRRMTCNKEIEEELSSLRKTIETQQLTISDQLVTLGDCTCKEEKQNYSDIHDAELESRFQQLVDEKDKVERSRRELRNEREELVALENKIKNDHKRFREERTQLFESNLLATPNLTSIKRENFRDNPTIDVSYGENNTIEANRQNHKENHVPNFTGNTEKYKEKPQSDEKIIPGEFIESSSIINTGQNRQKILSHQSEYDSSVTFTEVSRPGLRDGHLIFSPDPYENASANQIDDFTNHVLATPPPTQNVHMATTEEFNRELSRLDISNLHGKILNENSSMKETPVIKSDVTEPVSPDSGRDLFHVKQSLFNQYMNTPV